MLAAGEVVALTFVSEAGQGRDGKELVADWFRWGLARGKIVRVCGAERAAVQLDNDQNKKNAAKPKRFFPRLSYFRICWVIDKSQLIPHYAFRIRLKAVKLPTILSYAKLFPDPPSY